MKHPQGATQDASIVAQRSGAIHRQLKQKAGPASTLHPCGWWLTPSFAGALVLLIRSKAEIGDDLLIKGVGAGNGKTLRIHQALARKLAIKILSGRLKPGENLGGEIEQSEALGLSRTAYREAMRILTAKGLVESKPKAGTHVTPRSRWNLLDPDILAWMFSGQPDERFVRDLFELRGVIEPAAAAFAAERRTEEHLVRMREGIGGMRKFGLATARGRQADQHFHHAILEASGNDALASLSSSVGAAVTWTTYFKQRNRKSPRDALPDHEKVLAAIEAGDAKRAHAAMRELVTAALHDMGMDRALRASRRSD